VSDFCQRVRLCTEPLRREALWGYFDKEADERYKAKVAAQGGDGALTRLSMLALFAIGLLGSLADAKLLAGGHSLLPMMKLRLANPEHLIDINDLTELSYIREQEDEIRIGAMTRHVDLLRSDLLARHFPLFRDAENVIADPVVRNRGTIGGSLCQADPSEDLSAVFAAVRATAVIRGRDGDREQDAEDDDDDDGEGRRQDRPRLRRS